LQLVLPGIVGPFEVVYTGSASRELISTVLSRKRDPLSAEQRNHAAIRKVEFQVAHS
jgi:hypothetical protein